MKSIYNEDKGFNEENMKTDKLNASELIVNDDGSIYHLERPCQQAFLPDCVSSRSILCSVQKKK